MTPDRTILAHGLGGVRDLPLPLPLTVAGAAAALVVSFAVLAFAWRLPRYATPGTYDAGPIGRPAPGWLATLVDSSAWVLGWRLFGLAATAYLSVALFAGEDILINPVFGVFFVWLWVGLVPASLLLGPVLRAVSPFRTVQNLLCRALRVDSDTGVFGRPERWGYWPAAVGLFAFVWFELVVFGDNSTLSALRLWITVWWVLTLLGGLLFGEQFIGYAEPFEAYSSLVAKLSPWSRGVGGELRIASPLAHLATVPPTPGLVAVVSVLLGSTAFDSFSASGLWQGWVRDGVVDGIGVHTLALFVLCLSVGMLLGFGTLGQPTAFAHSVMPIVVGYIVAHYLSYLYNVGQETLIYVSDPLSTGANYLGTARYEPSRWLAFHPTLLASIKVGAVVCGHVVGVIAAHDRALAVLPPSRRLTGQLPLLVVMVCFTVGGLFLLFSA